MSAKWLFTFKHFKFPLLPLLTHSAMDQTFNEGNKQMNAISNAILYYSMQYQAIPYNIMQYRVIL